MMASKGPAAGNVDERQLIEAAQADPRRFADLYELHFDRVYAYVARRVNDRTAAEDVTSEVFQRALAGLPKFEWRGAPFAAWLYRMAANAIADRAARSSREAGFFERRALLYKLLRELLPDQRRVLELRFLKQKSIREIAALLDRSEGAVKQLQFRALETLREQAGERHG
jgi:RNA polymerase sigma-70 factor (ECF subfamily)